MQRTYTGIITELPENGIFCFGSNTQGRHGKGAALTAKNIFGAIYGQAKGMQGRSYAIVTKDLTKKVHPSIDATTIKHQINELMFYAFQHPELDFYIIYSGTGTNLNGYTNQEMADMFSMFVKKRDLTNIIFEEEFYKLINKD